MGGRVVWVLRLRARALGLCARCLRSYGIITVWLTLRGEAVLAILIGSDFYTTVACWLACLRRPFFTSRCGWFRFPVLYENLVHAHLQELGCLAPLGYQSISIDKSLMPCCQYVLFPGFTIDRALWFTSVS